MTLLPNQPEAWLIPALFAVCFSGLAYVLLEALREGSASYAASYEAEAERNLADMFLFISPRRILDMARIAATVCFIVLFLLTGDLTSGPGIAVGTVCGLIAAALALNAPRFALRFLKDRRVRMFNEQLVEALTTMSNALKAGFSIQQAFETIVKQGRNPIAQEFSMFLQQTRVGVRFEEAMGQLAERVPSEDLVLMISAIEIARKTGGNLTEVFDKIAATIRERARIEGRIQSLTAMGRLQGIVVGSMPALLLLALSLMEPEMIKTFVTSLPGIVTLIVVVLLEIAGALVIRKIIRIKV
ncbi:MAG: type II secretion system F family protein [Kiritimatiellia bacterium]